MKVLLATWFVLGVGALNIEANGLFINCTYILEKFPPIYAVEDFSQCTKIHENDYCICHVEINEPVPRPQYWNEIELRSRSFTHFDRKYFERGICVPKKLRLNYNRLRYIESKLGEELKSFNLSANVREVICKEEQQHSSLEKYFLCAIVLYLIFIVYATIYERKSGPLKPDSKLDEWIFCFSVSANWKKLTRYKTANSDFNRLRGIQAVRFYNMTLVIFCHTKLSWAQLFVSNPEAIEQAYQHIFFQLSMVLDVFLVQTFFVVSSWLLTNHVLEIHGANGRFTVKDSMILLLNRVVRYFPTLLFMVVLFRTPAVILSTGPLNFDLVYMNARACRHNWWATLFHTSNLLHPHEICNMGTWYLAIDTQFYIITMIILYFILKWKFNPRKILLVLIISTVIFNAVITFFRNLDIILRLSPENTKRHNFFRIPELIWQYTSFYFNWSTSLVGIGMGILYFRTKNLNEIMKYEKYYPWAFALLPLTVVYVASVSLGGISAVLLGPILKPLYAVGIALGLLGLSRKTIGGWIKNICEWKYAVILGNFSYCTYIFHFSIVFARGGGVNSLVQVEFLSFIKSAIADIICSWIIGIFMAVALEQPANNIQKMLLPQIEKKMRVLRINVVEDKVGGNVRDQMQAPQFAQNRSSTGVDFFPGKPKEPWLDHCIPLATLATSVKRSANLEDCGYQL
ncbi:nose resistant to fluoxetine protein 6-like [Cylas formicarius]|uniref:nose resistant to fluoxetine protein 6-like n=1 Tax=Cylas formicarius TaxID=197179 RepID=UPI002958ABF1|nr:nose resistant to fluoxetine protein 6-like [Cylas formicarius]